MSSKRYPEEFRSEAVEQIIDRGYSVQEVSKRLGVSTYSLYKWLRASGRWGKKSQTDEMDTMRQENLRLKAELKRAEEERDILKKAAAYFAKTPG